MKPTSELQQTIEERDQHWWAIRNHVEDHAGYLDHQQVCTVCIYHRNVVEKQEKNT